MSWILTKTGKEFHFDNVQPDMICLEDIAHALSNIKRFNGHVSVNASVALHSVVLSYAVPSDLAKQALFHDAHEAYVGDIVTPLKGLAFGWGGIEHKIDRVISDKFGVNLLKESDRRVVRSYDLMHLKYEREQFLPPGGTPWPCLQKVAKLAVHMNLSKYYDEHDYLPHKQLFLRRCKELGVSDVNQSLSKL